MAQKRAKEELVGGVQAKEADAHVDWLTELAKAEGRHVNMAVTALPEIARASTHIADTHHALDGLEATALGLRAIIDGK
jgi:hypothetical protein